jgi:hypothetical protein
MATLDRRLGRDVRCIHPDIEYEALRFITEADGLPYAATPAKRPLNVKFERRGFEMRRSARLTDFDSVWFGGCAGFELRHG